MTVFDKHQSINESVLLKETNGPDLADKAGSLSLKSFLYNCKSLAGRHSIRVLQAINIFSLLTKLKPNFHLYFESVGLFLSPFLSSHFLFLLCEYVCTQMSLTRTMQHNTSGLSAFHGVVVDVVFINSPANSPSL